MIHAVEDPAHPLAMCLDLVARHNDAERLHDRLRPPQSSAGLWRWSSPPFVPSVQLAPLLAFAV